MWRLCVPALTLIVSNSSKLRPSVLAGILGAEVAFVRARSYARRLRSEVTSVRTRSHSSGRGGVSECPFVFWAPELLEVACMRSGRILGGGVYACPLCCILRNYALAEVTSAAS